MGKRSVTELWGQIMKRWLSLLVAVIFVSGCEQETSAKTDPPIKVIEAFQDCEICPEMVIVPAGEFEMGARDNDPKAVKKRELARVQMRIPKSFALGRFEVTRPQYMACVDAGACDYRPTLMPWERALEGANKFPIVLVVWENAQQYVMWLSKVTGHTYSLPSEAEWEYAARAGTTTIYWWGDLLGKDNAHCVECGGGHRFTGEHKAPLPIGSYAPNPFGLYDMVGNVSEHVQDCFAPNVSQLPADGSAFYQPNCEVHALRGSAYRGYASSRQTRLSARMGTKSATRRNNFGFRVKRLLSE